MDGHLVAILYARFGVGADPHSVQTGKARVEQTIAGRLDCAGVSRS
jgi:hypothetical protein